MKKIIVTILILTFNFGIKFSSHSQATQVGTFGLGHAAGGIPTNYYLGWDASLASNIPLHMRHDRINQPIGFFTGGSTAASLRMAIMQSNYIVSTFPAGGFVGINETLPLQRLHVKGDINLETNIFIRNAVTDGYRINNKTVLSVKNSNDLFVGWGAGNSWTSLGVQENTFVGNNSGFSITSGDDNTMVGFNSDF